MKKYILSGIIVLLFNLTVFSQYAILKVAEREFESFNYAVAVDRYQEAYAKKPSLQAMKGIAKSYYQLRDFQNAEIWYSRLAKLENTTGEDILLYAHSLRNNAKFREAKAQYQRLENHPNRSVSLDELHMFYLSCDSAVVWIQNPRIDQEIENFGVMNSKFSDFGATNYRGQLVFSSDRNMNDNAAVYGWTGNAYLSLFTLNAGKIERFPLTWYNAEHHVGPVSFSERSNEVFFSVTRALTSSERRKASKMATVNVEVFYNDLSANDWGHNAKPFKYNNITEWSVGDPFLSQSGDTLYFVSDMPGGMGGTDIFYVIKQADGEWGNAINMGPLVNTSGDERFPSKDDNGAFYFSSDGHIGMGGLDIFVVKNTTGSKVENLGYPINSPADDFSIRFDQFSSGYLASNRVGGQGLDDVYRFSLNREIKIDLQGKVLNNKSGLPVSGASVILKDVSGTKEDVFLYSREDGSFNFNLDTEKEYQLTAAQTGFKIFNPVTLSTKGLKESQTLRQDLRLEPVEQQEVVVLRNIYFDFDKSDIRPDAAYELSKIHSFLISDPEVRIELSAHTDSRGTEAYNMALSQRRAESVIAFLVERGIDPNRLIAKGYGFSKLANHCAPGVECSEEEHEFNRRVEFFVLPND